MLNNAPNFSFQNAPHCVYKQNGGCWRQFCWGFSGFFWFSEFFLAIFHFLEKLTSEFLSLVFLGGGFNDPILNCSR